MSTSKSTRASSPPSLSRLLAEGLAAAAAALALSACAGSGSIPDPNAKHVGYAERGGYPATLPSLKNGRRLYVNRCSGCHDLYKPADYPPGDWPRIVLDMQDNAELNDVQLVDITRYLVAVSMGAREAAVAPATGTPTETPAPAAPAAQAPTAAEPGPAPAADSGGIAPPAGP